MKKIVNDFVNWMDEFCWYYTSFMNSAFWLIGITRVMAMLPEVRMYLYGTESIDTIQKFYSDIPYQDIIKITAIPLVTFVLIIRGLPLFLKCTSDEVISIEIFKWSALAILIDGLIWWKADIKEVFLIYVFCLMYRIGKFAYKGAKSLCNDIKEARERNRIKQNEKKE